MTMIRFMIKPPKFWIKRNLEIRMNSTSSFIRSSFIDYFVTSHNHKYVKSSPVMPLCDPTVPFVNAGMNQFKGVFLGNVEEPCPRAVNSQKCVRAGGKHNDLDVVGTDSHHHTFFEMLGNWSFGDYYKKEACQMAWDLLLGLFRLKPEDMVITYFAGDPVLGLIEDRECRDVWKSLGVSPSRITPMNAKDNFWEMGATGPCGPCTEIHKINSDGSLTEIWNIVFIQCNREADGSIKALRRHHVDTGMGLERMCTIMQRVPSNYDTDLFRPIIRAIETNSVGVDPYGGSFCKTAVLDCAYRRLADHARMISVCLSDGVFPATSLNLKQIMRKSFKISSDIFGNPQLLLSLYDEVAASLGSTYPELNSKAKDAKLIIRHEEQSYGKLRANLAKKWKTLVNQFPEVENLSDIELPGFSLGYKEFKEQMMKQQTNVIPAELVFILYDRHGFNEEVIERIAKLNNLELEKEGFLKLLEKHKSRHKAAIKEQSMNRGILFNAAVERLVQDGVKQTNDQHKYKYSLTDNTIKFEPLKTNLVAILSEDCEWIDVSEPCEDRSYYLITKDTNFYCEEGGQIADSGIIHIKNNFTFKVNNVFKIREFVIHKGNFCINMSSSRKHINNTDSVILEIDGAKRLQLMQNHTSVHLLNAAFRKVLSNSVVCQVGSHVSDKGFSLNFSVYGDKISQEVVLEVEESIRKSILSNSPVETRVVDSLQLTKEESLVTIPGETYPETGIRLVRIGPPLESKELCCGTHVPSTRFVEDLVVTGVKGAGGQTPNVYALSGESAKQAREQFARALKLCERVAHVEPQRLAIELREARRTLSALGCGAPAGRLAHVLAALDAAAKRAQTVDSGLQSVVQAEVEEAMLETGSAGRGFLVHFLRCSYLMQGEEVRRAARRAGCRLPALLIGCAGGTITAVCTVPQELISESFSAELWMCSALPAFEAHPAPGATTAYAEMAPVEASLITCEQQVQDAMRAAILFAKTHLVDDAGAANGTQGRQQN